jgi:hypothetical protein
MFSPDEKRLYVIDTGFTDGPDNPSHIRVFDVDVATVPGLPSSLWARLFCATLSGDYCRGR